MENPILIQYVRKPNGDRKAVMIAMQHPAREDHYVVSFAMCHHDDIFNRRTALTIAKQRAEAWGDRHPDQTLELFPHSIQKNIMAFVVRCNKFFQGKTCGIIPADGPLRKRIREAQKQAKTDKQVYDVTVTFEPHRGRKPAAWTTLARALIQDGATFHPEWLTAAIQNDHPNVSVEQVTKWLHNHCVERRHGGKKWVRRIKNGVWQAVTPQQSIVVDKATGQMYYVPLKKQTKSAPDVKAPRPRAWWSQALLRFVQQSNGRFTVDAAMKCIDAEEEVDSTNPMPTRKQVLDWLGHHCEGMRGSSSAPKILLHYHDGTWGKKI